MPKRVVILGAGIAGLSAAWELSKEGIDVDVIESQPCVGGLCRSIRKNDFIFDLGGHRFVTKDTAIFNKIEGLLGNDLMVRRRKSVIYLKGKFFAYPPELYDILRKMRPDISARCAFDFFMVKFGAYSGMQDISLKNWVLKRFGRTMYDIYFGPYSKKLWGIAPDKISADWAGQRISLLNIMDVVLRLLSGRNNSPRTYAHNFIYPKKGIGQIAQAMAEEITSKNGRIHLNSIVEKIILDRGRIKSIIYRQSGVEKEISAELIVSTMPLPEFMLSIEPKISGSQLHTAKSMAFRGIKFVHITLDKEKITDNTWIYVPEGKYIFFRIQDRRNWSPYVVPEGKNALTLEIACNKGDDIWNMNDNALLKRCVSGLENMGLIRRKDISGYFTESAEHAYPVYSLGYKENVQQAYDFLSGIKNLISIGRQGLYRYNNMDHSIKMGLLAADNILHDNCERDIFSVATEDVIFDWQHSGCCERVSGR
ncbi:MAG: FAD-dependent oxidoreductase [Candidatus Omnitrophica bacterium]|nr:FAD-dependent oxidoreductase [Candidatus Omnitrophota bacterium]